MSDSWKSYLKPEESLRLEVIDVTQRSMAAERRRIIDRCRKRARKGSADADA